MLTCRLLGVVSRTPVSVDALLGEGRDDFFARVEDRVVTSTGWADGTLVVERNSLLTSAVPVEPGVAATG